MTTARRLLALLLASVLVFAAACGGDDDDSADSGGGDDAGTSVDDALRVPEDYETIQAAVDAAEPGDLVLIAPGIYEEAVDVETEDLTIRGLDRNEVDPRRRVRAGERHPVARVDGVAVENMTARNYTDNGFFWTGVDGYRGSYLTAVPQRRLRHLRLRLRQRPDRAQPTRRAAPTPASTSASATPATR